MFEMLGNWSFGDYFKEGAIDYAWEYLVEVLHLNPKDLYVTIFEGSPEENIPRDDEAARYWAKHLPTDHIIEGDKLERLLYSVNFQDLESMRHFQSVLDNIGIFNMLREKGIQDGDTVSLYGFEFEFYN